MEDLNLEEVCRLCLTKHTDMRLALDVGAIDRLFDCASVQIPPDSLICEFCKNEVDKWYSFKQQVLKSLEVAKYIEEQRKDEKSTPEDTEDNYLMIEECFVKSEHDYELEDVEVKPDISQIANLHSNDQSEHLDSEELQIRPPKKRTNKCKKTQKRSNKPKSPVTIEVTKEEAPIIKEESEEESKYQCDLCHKSFNSELGIMWHKQLHSALRLDSSKSTILFSCPCCPMTYEKKLSLTDHMKWKHPRFSKSSSYDFCDICAKFCKSKLDMKTHLKFHMKEVQMPCDICSKSFLSLNSLVLHRRVHQNGSLCCKYCKRNFKLMKTLREHEATHEHRYKCPDCSKSFRNNYILKKHMKSH